MTANAPGQGTAPPLAATLERVSAPGTDDEIDLSSRLGVPDEPGWMTVADLVRDTSLLGDMMDRIGRGYGMDNPAYSGTSLLRGYLWRMLTPAVAALLAERRLPDLRAENAALRFGESGFAKDAAFIGPRFFVLPDDPEAGHPDAVAVPSEDALLGGMRAALSETHLPVLIPALRALRVRRGTRALWRAAADVCAEAFLFVGRDLGREEEACTLAEKLLDAPSPLSAPTNFYALAYPGGSERTRVRHTCCLYYKVGDGCCFTCPRKSDEERIRQLAREAPGRWGSRGHE